MKNKAHGLHIGDLVVADVAGIIIEVHSMANVVKWHDCGRIRYNYRELMESFSDDYWKHYPVKK